MLRDQCGFLEQNAGDRFRFCSFSSGPRFDSSLAASTAGLSGDPNPRTIRPCIEQKLRPELHYPISESDVPNGQENRSQVRFSGRQLSNIPVWI
jgi:hypothetical protein